MALTTVPASLSATALTLTTAAQPNITSVGTLTGLTVSGNIAGTLTTAAQTNITSVGTLTSLTVSGALNGTLSTAAQTNITSLGTLSALTVSGDLTVDTSTLKVDSTNNRVGIGNPSPNRQVSLKHASQAEIGFKTGSVSNGALIYYNDSENKLLLRTQESGEHIEFQTGGTTERMRIDSSGNVGIGTNSPSAKLHIEYSNNAATGGMTFRNTSTGSSAYTGFYFGNDTSATDAFVGQLGSNTGAYGGARSFLLGTNSSGGVGFMTAGTLKMLLSGSGNLGIGTTAPDLPLHVNGTNAYPATSGTTPNGMLTLRNKAGSASHGLYMGVANASPWGSWLQASDAGNLATEYPLLLNPNGGNVGIGTTAPGYKLEVNGTAHVVNTLSAGAVTIPSQGITLNQAFGTGVPTITMTGTANNGRGGAINFKESDGSGGSIADTAAIYSTDGSGSNSTYGGLTIAAYQGDMKFSTGGLSSPRLVINSSGTATFNGDVNVFGANRKLAIGESGAGGTFGHIGWDDAANYLYLGTSYNSAFNQDIVLKDGNVGIGTSNPGAKIHVDPAANVTTGFGTPLVKVGGDNSWAGGGSLYSIGFGYVDTSISNKSPAEIGIVTTSSAGYTKGDLVFATRNSTGNDTPTERMRIDSAGRITKSHQTYAQGRGNGGWASFSSGTWSLQPHGTTPVMSSNRGNSYSTSNKRFTAPVAGVYLVQASWYVKQTTAASPASQYIHPGLYVNGLVGWNGGYQAYQIFGHEMNRSGTSTKHYEGVSISYTLYLSAGDYVEIRVYSPNASPQSYEYYHYFSYALLY